MKPISSPWIHQLRETRSVVPLTSSVLTEVAIVGAGIAGICTAFFVLKYTNKKVVLIEAGKAAHGATGHNAGQIVSYFEHPFAHLVGLYGITLAARAQEQIFFAWDLLEELYADAQLKVPLARFTGYAGCSSIEQIIDHLENIRFQREAGLDIEGVLVANLPFIINQIPPKYRELFARVDHRHILDLLETNDRRYIGVLASRKGCVNSALVCEEVLEYLEQRYPERFVIYEHSPVEKIVMGKAMAHVRGSHYQVQAERVVLCTNGFSKFTIENTDGSNEIDTRFHQTVIGKIGYMAGYLEPPLRPPTAISYFTPQQTAHLAAYNRHKSLDAQEPYFYLTRRPFEHKHHGMVDLICIGGPESDLTQPHQFSHDLAYPDFAQEQISEFMKTTFRPFPSFPPDYTFRWHGLMGYTKSGVRLIGPDPENDALLYNLGCNGVGILSSIFGGKRIADFLLHHKLEPSIFDPARIKNN